MENDRPVLLHDRKRRPPDDLAVLRLHAGRSRPRALRQFAPYLKNGHLLSADGQIDYSARLGEVTVPTLMVAGAGDLISDVPSTRMTFDALGSADKTLVVFGKSNGHVADYGHCDLAWSRYAPKRDLPGHDRLARPPPAGRERRRHRPRSPGDRSNRLAALTEPSQEGFDADL